MSGDAGSVWKRTGWLIAPRDAREVMQVLGSIGVYSRGQRFAWRGMSSADYELRSSLHRRLGPWVTEDQLREVEIAELAAAREWGLGVAETGHSDDLQLLADLQHFGAPTRLLDFTSNPMTALWFACQDAPERGGTFGGRLTKSGLVVALNVTKWPKHATVGDPYSSAWGAVGNPSGWNLQNALQSPGPFVVEQSVANPRLRAQEGFFVASSLPNRSALSSLMTPFASLDLNVPIGDPDDLESRLTAVRGRGNPSLLPVVAVFIKSQLKSRLLAYLEDSYNRSARVLFPDYQGFVQNGLPSMEEVERPGPPPAEPRGSGEGGGS